MLRRIITYLLAATLFLPIAELVLLGLAKLLGALGDAAGEAVVNRVCLAGGVAWTLALVALVIALALEALAPPKERN